MSLTYPPTIQKIKQKLNMNHKFQQIKIPVVRTQHTYPIRPFPNNKIPIIQQNQTLENPLIATLAYPVTVRSSAIGHHPVATSLRWNRSS